MLERIKNEPVAVTAIIEAALALALAFGADLTGEQVATVVAFATLVLAFVARQQVTPTRAPALDDGHRDADLP